MFRPLNPDPHFINSNADSVYYQPKVYAYFGDIYYAKFYGKGGRGNGQLGK